MTNGELGMWIFDDELGLWFFLPHPDVNPNEDDDVQRQLQLRAAMEAAATVQIEDIDDPEMLQTSMENLVQLFDRVKTRRTELNQEKRARMVEREAAEVFED